MSSSSLSWPDRYSSSIFGMTSNGFPLPKTEPTIRFSRVVRSKPGSWMVFLPLADRGECRRDDFFGHDADGDECLVRAEAAGDLGDDLLRGRGVGGRVGRA